jgi:hypothetical protein
MEAKGVYKLYKFMLKKDNWMADLCAGRRDARQPGAVSRPHCLAPRAGNRPTGFPTGNLPLSGASRKMVRTVTCSGVNCEPKIRGVRRKFILKHRRQEIVRKDSTFSIN